MRYSIEWDVWKDSLMFKSLGLLFGAALLAISLVSVAAAADGDTLEVPFVEQNGSGISGTATLVEQAGKTTVTVALTGASTTVEQPAHIHVGTCATLNPVPTYPLNNVVQGHSETVVDASIDSLLASPFAINVHKSSEEISVYVACADLVASTSGQIMPNTGGPDTGTPVLIPLAGAGMIVLGAGLLVYRRQLA